MDQYLPLLLFYLICGFAAVIHGAVGIGFPLIATPLIAMITDVRTAILILIIPNALINVVNIIKGGSWNNSIALYWPLALYGIIGNLVGAQLLVLFSAEIFRPLLAAAILLYLNTDRLGIRLPWVRSTPHLAMAFFGISGGLLGGTVNVMLPALVIFALESRMNKTAMIQLFNFCFLFGKMTQGLVFYHAGLFTSDILSLSIPLAGAGLVVMMMAMSIRSRLEEYCYRKWLRGLLFILAVVLLIQFFIWLAMRFL